MNLPKSKPNLEKKPNHIELRLKCNGRTEFSGRSSTSPQGLRATSQEYQMPTPIFYNPKQNVIGVSSYSPSASKPARFAELMAHYDFRSYGNGFSPVTPVEKEDLYRVHRRDHVDNVFSGKEPNGFGNHDPRLPTSCLWTIGSLLCAARWAMANPILPVCAPVSGFHHAGYSWGSESFCTFNGLMVAAAKLVAENPKIRVGILDCDQHFGNGTEDILKHFPLLAKRVLHRTAGEYFLGDDPETEALEFQAWLDHSIKEINAFGCDIVLYQAGGDPHVNDPMGGFLDDTGLAMRDRTVFCGIEAPISWVLAGGYQRSKNGDIFTDPVLQIHRTTLMESNHSVKTRQARIKGKPSDL